MEKDFFGDDPKLATKNLPRDMIDKIQVFDALNDQSAFTGLMMEIESRPSISQPKKIKRKGYFEGAILGGGSDSEEGRCDNSVNLSYFNGDRQLTFTGRANNVNKQNFGAQDLFGGGGGGGGENHSSCRWWQRRWWRCNK